ncbi:MAG: hypothetical protein HQ525_04615 [Anaerolineae bacterium]|mgnify:CR=1 FL=1|uniref:Uncharacterized protein n=1 Tax=Candidatus Desulfolinea nitratireducens TaxID=2841698 RepID=A0A8J6TEB6_9CHLR|nr:hypothetical protein [Candidatus Desulfolinea nitratireducens]MBL6960549.1 hypothetical protein [Anaerolineales bacterium]NQU29929.1 hypothetical protein [Anaerolineae bacterium]
MKSWKNYFKEMAIIAGVVLLVFLMMDYNSRLDKLNQLNDKALTVRAEATEVNQTQITLQTQIAEATSDAITEREARNSGEIQEGDQRIVPLPSDGPPLPDTFIPTPVPERIKKWQVWMELFFGR